MSTRDYAAEFCRHHSERIQEKFRQIPRERNQTYLQHVATQGTRGLWITGYGCLTLVNAVFPFWLDGIDRRLVTWLQ